MVDRPAFDEVDGFIQHSGVACAVRSGKLPTAARVIIRTACARPDLRRMPPVLDIAFPELTAAQKELLAHEMWLGMDERHHVLQLIAETEAPPIDSIRSAPKGGTREFGTRASRWSAR